MKNRRRCRSIIVTKAKAAALALTVTASGIALPAVAQAAAPSFNGSYTVVQKSFTIDPSTGARIDRPDQVSIWIAFSPCTITGCVAHVVSNSLHTFDMVFDGTQWNRVALPPRTGICNGAIVPARAAAEFLVPQSDGSLSGAVTSTVDCDGVLLDSSLPLIANPS